MWSHVAYERITSHVNSMSHVTYDWDMSNTKESCRVMFFETCPMSLGQYIYSRVYRDSVLETAQEAVPLCVYSRDNKDPKLCVSICIYKYLYIHTCIGPLRPKLSAIAVAEKTLFERLYLVPGLRKFAPWVNCPYAPTTPTIHFYNYFSISVQFFSPNGPSNIL